MFFLSISFVEDDIYTSNTRSVLFDVIFNISINIFLTEVWYLVNLAIFDLMKNIPSTTTASASEGCEFACSFKND